MEKTSKDEIADKLWGRNYDQLSEWGRKKVDHVFDRINPVETSVETDPQSLVRENIRLASELERTKVENLDLWEELSETKAELAELQASLNHPLS